LLNTSNLRNIIFILNFVFLQFKTAYVVFSLYFRIWYYFKTMVNSSTFFLLVLIAFISTIGSGNHTDILRCGFKLNINNFLFMLFSCKYIMLPMQQYWHQWSISLHRIHGYIWPRPPTLYKCLQCCLLCETNRPLWRYPCYYYIFWKFSKVLFDNLL